MTWISSHSKARSLILSQTEKSLENLWEKLFRKIEREMILQVKKWEARWPRHKFRMALMHGSLMVFVDPPVMGFDMPTRIKPSDLRNAFADLNEEIQLFDDFLTDIASEMGRPADGLDTKHPHYQTR